MNYFGKFLLLFFIGSSVFLTAEVDEACTTSNFPHFREKYRFESLLTPEKQLEHYKAIGNFPTISPPKTLIVCYSDKRMDALLKNYTHQQCDGCFSNIYFLKDYPGVAISKFGMTAPLSAMDLDRTIAWGIKNFIVIGTASPVGQNFKTVGKIALQVHSCGCLVFR